MPDHPPPDLSESIVHHVAALEHFVIYDHPRDAPWHFVVRRWVMEPGQEPRVDLSASYADTLEGARGLVPPGLYCLARSPEDDPVIVETWI